MTLSNAVVLVINKNTKNLQAALDFVARAVGMPDIPRAIIEHPCAGSGRDNLERVARELAPRLLTALAGADT